MNNAVKESLAHYKSEANKVFDKLLVDCNSNFDALYGKSLILFSQGKIEESAEIVKKLLDMQPETNHARIAKLKDCLIDLLELKAPKVVAIIDEIQQDYLQIDYPFVTYVPAPQELAVNHPGTTIANNAQLPSKPSFQPKQPKSCFCIICNKTFSKMYSLARHMLIHNGIKNHKCESCGRCFVQKVDLERHKSVHDVSYNFVCSYDGCGKRFKMQKSMRSHSKIHCENRSMNCAICCRSFLSKRNLKIHLDAVHYGILPFACDCCGKTFAVKASLRSHMTTHSKFKLFPCSDCSSSFKRAFDLRSHYKTFHCELQSVATPSI